jgi:hypothetical protein
MNKKFSFLEDIPFFIVLVLGLGFLNLVVNKSMPTLVGGIEFIAAISYFLIAILYRKLPIVTTIAGSYLYEGNRAIIHALPFLLMIILVSLINSIWHDMSTGILILSLLGGLIYGIVLYVLALFSFKSGKKGSFTL